MTKRGLPYSVYINGQLAATCAESMIAACIVANIGSNGSQILYHNLTCWTEGAEDKPASESYDYVSATCLSRIQAYKERVRK